MIVVTTVAVGVGRGRSWCCCCCRGHRATHEGVQIGTLIVVPCSLGGRKGLALIERCEWIAQSIVDNARVLEFVGCLGGEGRG